MSKDKPKTCEWKWAVQDGADKLYYTACQRHDKRLRIKQRDSTHCPFCGGKITEVE